MDGIEVLAPTAASDGGTYIDVHQVLLQGVSDILAKFLAAFASIARCAASKSDS